MNNSFLKILSIFLILLFCLSPLAAIDLGQGDSSAQINDNNNTNFKDLNDTVIADDTGLDDNAMEIESDNETDDINAVDDVEIQNVSINDSNSTKNLQKANPKLSMEVEDSVYGESAIVKIYFASDFGITYGQKVKVQGNNIYETYKCNLTGGSNVIKLRDDLPPGTYTVSYSFAGSSWYNSASVSGQFVVHKRDSAIDCSVKDVGPGEVPVVKINTKEHLESNYAYVTSPQFSKEYKIDLSGSSGSVNIDENFTTGYYSCNVFYPGDRFHNSQNTTVNFKVARLDPNLTVELSDISKGENLFVKIHANKTLNGDVTCKVIRAIGSNSSSSLNSGETVTVHLVDGEGSVTMYCRNLAVGDYMVCTGFSGDSTFRPDLVFRNFKVKAATDLRNNNVNGTKSVCTDSTESGSLIGHDMLMDNGHAIKQLKDFRPRDYYALVHYLGTQAFAGEKKTV